MKRRRIAIVGAGFSGTALALQLDKCKRPALEVMIIERRRRFGPGLAYGTTDPSHLLNVRAGNLSALADDPSHFARWLERRGMRDNAPSHFARRAIYASYLEDVLRRSGGMFGSKVKRVRASITACNPLADGWALSTDRGGTLHADIVVLALGIPPPSAPAALEAGAVPLIDPRDRTALRGVARGDVLLLGSGLTSVDVALSLARTGRKGITYMLSRRGQIPRPHLTNPAPPPPRATELPLPLSEALLVLRREVEAAAGRGEPWQHVIDRLRARTPELWQRLPAEAQRRFLRHLRPWWDAHRHRMAPEIAAQLATLQNEGRVRLLAGEVVAAEQAGKLIHIHHRQRGSMARHHLQVAGVVNCTGASMDMANSEDPLLLQLFADGLVRAPSCGLGLDVDADGQVLSPSGSVQPNLRAVGPITQGVFWESTAVPEIRVRAAAMAAQLSR